MSNTAITLSRYRIEQSNQCIKSAKVLAEIGDYKGAANRAYFRREYIKTGVFDVKLSDIISIAFEIRSDSDYDDFYIISIEEVTEQIENARYFICKITEYLERNGVE